MKRAKKKIQEIKQFPDVVRLEAHDSFLTFHQYSQNNSIYYNGIFFLSRLNDYSSTFAFDNEANIKRDDFPLLTVK